MTDEEIQFLKGKCYFLPDTYIAYLKTCSLRPAEHVQLTFHADEDNASDADVGSIELHVAGLWVETILYEIPLLALISETYFRFMDTDWTHDGQYERAREKGRQLLKNVCTFSEFGSRRRRDYRTQELVVQGLIDASKEGEIQSWQGKLTGTSNVHFAMRFGLTPIGTVAHEWFMGVAAITDDYENANEVGLRNWVDVFGEGVSNVVDTCIGQILTGSGPSYCIDRYLWDSVILKGISKANSHNGSHTGIVQDVC